MRKVVVAILLWLCLGGAVALAQFGFAGSGTPSPVTMYVGNGEFNNSSLGLGDPTGRTPVTPTLPATSALVITTWQSNIQSAAAGTYTTTQANSLNFSIYNAKLYPCENPVLGAAYDVVLGSNSANCQIADGLITNGAYTHVIVASIAIGGTLCSDWVSGVLRKRISVLAQQLATAHLTASTGFTGHTWILAHGGESDKNAGTPQVQLATCIRDYAAAFTADGITGFRFFVPTESMTSNTTSATVTGAQADAVASGCSTCRQGANVDSLTGATNRQADGTHLTQTGAANLSALDVTVITNCKNTSCFVFFFVMVGRRRRT